MLPEIAILTASDVFMNILGSCLLAASAVAFLLLGASFLHKFTFMVKLYGGYRTSAAREGIPNLIAGVCFTLEGVVLLLVALLVLMHSI